MRLRHQLLLASPGRPTPAPANRVVPSPSASLCRSSGPLQGAPPCPSLAHSSSRRAAPLLVPPVDVCRRASLARLGAPSLFRATFDDQGGRHHRRQRRRPGELGEGGGWLGFCSPPPPPPPPPILSSGRNGCASLLLPSDIPIARGQICRS
jgi:hypothetical protein